MGLETFDFIDDLNATFPFGSDDVSEGDDHLRGVKLTLQNAFPSNDGPGSFPNMDFVMRDLVATRNLAVDGQINAAHQVAIALTTVDGLSGNITGPNFGVDATVRTGVGRYEMQLTEKDWTAVEDLQCGLVVNVGLVFGFGVMAIPTVNVGPGWIQVATHGLNEPQPGDSTDCALFHIVIFDAGRDFPI